VQDGPILPKLEPAQHVLLLRDPFSPLENLERRVRVTCEDDMSELARLSLLRLEHDCSVLGAPSLVLAE
jgi:hypothetical protein